MNDSHEEMALAFFPNHFRSFLPFSEIFNSSVTDRPTDRPTDRGSYRGAMAHLKRPVIKVFRVLCSLTFKISSYL